MERGGGGGRMGRNSPVAILKMDACLPPHWKNRPTLYRCQCPRLRPGPLPTVVSLPGLVKSGRNRADGNLVSVCSMAIVKRNQVISSTFSLYTSHSFVLRMYATQSSHSRLCVGTRSCFRLASDRCNVPPRPLVRQKAANVPAFAPLKMSFSTGSCALSGKSAPGRSNATVLQTSRCSSFQAAVSARRGHLTVSDTRTHR
jgi:hypothetical protein